MSKPGDSFLSAPSDLSDLPGLCELSDSGSQDHEGRVLTSEPAVIGELPLTSEPPLAPLPPLTGAVPSAAEPALTSEPSAIVEPALTGGSAAFAEFEMPELVRR